MNRNPGIQALEWVPRVLQRECAPYEAAAHRDGFPNFEIREKVNGALKPAGRRRKDFPVYCVEPYQENAASLGFDLASEPTRLDAMERARDSEDATTTGRILLVRKDKRNKDGFLVFLPVYRKEA